MCGPGPKRCPAWAWTLVGWKRALRGGLDHTTWRRGKLGPAGGRGERPAPSYSLPIHSLGVSGRQHDCVQAMGGQRPRPLRLTEDQPLGGTFPLANI